MHLAHPRRHRRTGTSLMLACAAIVALALVLLIASCGGSSTTTTAGVTTTASGAQVSIQGFAFNPASITIKVGDSVTWTNNDSATHTVTADNNGDFTNSGNLAQGATYTAKFDKAGTFAYHCSIHPSMKATITVQ